MQNGSKRCYICGSSYTLQEHHLILQARGGKEGPTVWLCATHHAAAHSAALSRTDNLHAHFLPQHLTRARPIVAAIRMSLSKSTEGMDDEPIVTMIFKITPKMRRILHQQKIDQGFTSLNDYLFYVLKRLTRT